jgi:hypothetical protein
MDSSDDRAPATGDLHLREYAVRAAKAYLCVTCWAGIVAVLLLYGPPPMSLPSISGGVRTVEAVDAAFGILLSAGTGTFLTIVAILSALACIGRQHGQSADRQHQEGTDSTEDETHA